MKITYTLPDTSIVKLVAISCNVKESAVRKKLQSKSFRKRMTKFAKDIFVANVTDDTDSVNEEFNTCFKEDDFLAND